MHLLFQRDVMEEAHKRNWLIFHAGSTQGLRGFIPDVYYYREEASTPLISQSSFDLLSVMRVHIGDTIGHSVNQAILEVDGIRATKYPGEFAGNLIVKHASTVDDMARLYNEYDIYRSLEKAKIDRVPKVIGLFGYANIEEDDKSIYPCFALVMEDVGKPVFQLAGEFTRQHLYVSIFRDCP
jgi:hypothetical protein